MSTPLHATAHWAGDISKRASARMRAFLAVEAPSGGEERLDARA
jgi:hypothetical protein